MALSGVGQRLVAVEGVCGAGRVGQAGAWWPGEGGGQVGVAEWQASGGGSTAEVPPGVRLLLLHSNAPLPPLSNPELQLMDPVQG